MCTDQVRDLVSLSRFHLLKKNQFILPAKGQGIFSPVYIDNLLDGIFGVATQSHTSGQIYNITDGIDVSCLDFFSHHWRWAGKKENQFYWKRA